LLYFAFWGGFMTESRFFINISSLIISLLQATNERETEKAVWALIYQRPFSHLFKIKTNKKG